jgi:divalent metal cation (Fe/Co/Zn/Cd) transporter
MNKIIGSKYYKVAFGLAIFTIVYNLFEGIISTYFGYSDESLALFGFGLDSFVETVSGLGIAHMIVRITTQETESYDQFEKTALKITGYSFYTLALVLLITGFYNIITNHAPTTTIWGIIISVISIIIMWALAFWKVKTGNILHSDAILADAECTKVCIYMSVVLLISSAVYEVTGFVYLDSLGAIGLAYYSFKEGKESLEKAKTGRIECCDHD